MKPQVDHEKNIPEKLKPELHIRGGVGQKKEDENVKGQMGKGECLEGRVVGKFADKGEKTPLPVPHSIHLMQKQQRESEPE